MGNVPFKQENVQSDGASNAINVRLVKTHHVMLGLVVRERIGRPRIVITDIIEGSPCATSGLIQKGDFLLKIDGVDVRNCSSKFVEETLNLISIGDSVNLLCQGREGSIAYLQTVFLENGASKTVRVSIPEEEGYLRNGQFQVKSNEAIETSTEEDSMSSLEKLRGYLKCKLAGTDQTISESTGEVLSNELQPHATQTQIEVKGQVNGSPKIVLSEANGRVEHGKSLPEREISGMDTKRNSNGESDILGVGTTVSPSLSRRGSCCSVKARRYQRIHNLIDGSVMSDTLHNAGVPFEGQGCNTQICRGSLLSTPPNRAPGEARPREEVLLDAKDFIDQYYTSIKRLNTKAHQERWQEVADSIEKTGIYELTTSELTFGAKTAWRNAPRCIGRIQWSKLQVFDARHIITTQGMFDALCNHIKYATNKGNIRSAITIFPPRTEGGHDFRIWNKELISYAGYKQPDGSVIGDPAHLQFTEVCQSMGWQGEGGMFDVLPLVLQVNGKDPELYTIPPSLVLEVEITHPKYPWFKDLGLRWFGLPAVSNISLDCGGLEFTAAPFNGWYMGTEIGARDFCDTARYNLSEKIAKNMGLDTSRMSSLWKDQAIVEANIAVLYSFQKNKVTITDHHTASESFMKYMENEMRLRGGTPADWVWIVPPISGSACPVFHQEMLNYKLKPSYEYLEDPWKTHVWEKEKNTTDTTAGTKRRKRTFKEIAKAVNFSARLMGHALSRRIKCNILYATETGKSETFAKRLCEIFRHAFDAKVMGMEDYDIIHLEHETLVLFVVSTFGNGDPPENGEDFARSLYSMMKPAQTTGSYIRMESLGSSTVTSSTADHMKNADNLLLHTGPLSNVRYSVFGLGSRAYPKFCSFGKFVDRLLCELGGERIWAMGEGDELCGQEQSFQTWAGTVFKEACETFCLGEGINMAAASNSLTSTDLSWAPSKFRIVPSEGASTKDLCEALSTMHHKNVKPCRMISRTYLQARESDRQTILVKLDTQEYDSELMYNPGDHLGIFPSNRSEIVEAILQSLDNSTDPDALIHLEKLVEKTTVLDDNDDKPPGTMKQWISHDRLPDPISIRIALSRYLDITTPPTPVFLKFLVTIATDDGDKTKLQHLIRSEKIYEEWKHRLHPTLAEVLAEFPSVRPCPTLLLSQLPLLQPRFYSISSSPRMLPGQIHATVAVVNYRTQDGNGPVHYGVCSNWLNKRKEGDIVPCFVRGSSMFHLPDDRGAPIIMVGPGSGIAPFRSFWQQRKVEMEMDTNPSGRHGWGPMYLYFGCRHAHLDNIYRDETSQMEAEGVLTTVYTALSRTRGQPKTYVQHMVKQNGSEVAEMILKHGGHFYVCGDVTMAEQVTETLETILMEYGRLTSEMAKEYIIRMREKTRFHEDIFGTLRIEDVRDAVKLQTSKLPDFSETT